MKLNVSPKELLALYNLLYEQQGLIRSKYDPGTDQVPDYVYLDQVFGRVRSLIVASVGRQSDDPVDTKKAREEEVLAREQAKIDKLKVELVEIKKDQAQLASVPKPNKDFLMPEDEDDLKAPEYPTRPRRASGGHHGRKK